MWVFAHTLEPGFRAPLCWCDLPVLQLLAIIASGGLRGVAACAPVRGRALRSSPRFDKGVDLISYLLYLLFLFVFVGYQRVSDGLTYERLRGSSYADWLVLSRVSVAGIESGVGCGILQTCDER